MFKNKYLLLAVVIIAILAVLCVCVGSNDASVTKNYINVSDDGVIKFDATGFEVNEMDVIEEVYTGQFVNKTFYNIKDNFGREAEITIHHSSMDDPDSKELEYLNSDFFADHPLWVGNHSGNYYSVLISDTNVDNYFDSDFVCQRIVIG